MYAGKRVMKRFLSAVFTFISIVCSPIYTHGFVGSTYVHTESGMCTIKKIYETYSPYELGVYGCSETTFSPFTQRMIKAAEGETQHRILIVLEGVFPIECAPYQPFYVVGTRKPEAAVRGTPQDGVENCIDWLISNTELGPTYVGKRVAPECGIGQWKRACDIKVDDYLFCKNNWHRWVSEVRLIEGKTAMYALEIESIHTYFVGDAQVLAHNFAIQAGYFLMTAYYATGTLAAAAAAAFATKELITSYAAPQGRFYACPSDIPREALTQTAQGSWSKALSKAVPVAVGAGLTGYFGYQCFKELQRFYYAIEYLTPDVIRACSTRSHFEVVGNNSSPAAAGRPLTISPLMNAVYAGQSPYGSYVLSQEQQEKGTQVSPPIQTHITDGKGKGSGGGGGPEKEPDDDKNSLTKAAGAAATTLAQNEEVEKKVVEGAQSLGEVVEAALDGAVEVAKNAKEFIQHVVSEAGQAVKDGRVKYEVTKILEGSMPHIFRNEPGHFEKATPENIKFLLDIAKDMKNFIDFDKRGNAWFHKILEDGTQVWISAWNQTIRNAGINDVIHQFDPDTGLAYNMMKFK